MTYVICREAAKYQDTGSVVRDFLIRNAARLRAKSDDVMIEDHEEVGS